MYTETALSASRLLAAGTKDRLGREEGMGFRFQLN
jgi:hypothetical protein